MRFANGTSVLLAACMCLLCNSQAAERLSIVVQTFERVTTDTAQKRHISRLRRFGVDPESLSIVSNDIVIPDTAAEKDARVAAWACRGNRFFFRTEREESTRKLGFEDKGESFIRTLDNHTTRTLNINLKAMANTSRTGGTIREVQMRSPTISPKGDKMAFVVEVVLEDPLPPPSYPKWDTAVAVYDFETALIRIVAPFGYVSEQPVFSPDGEMIAFYRAPFEIFQEAGQGESNDQHGHRLCVVSTGGGEVRVLSSAPNTMFTGLYNPPSWSPDGKRILFEAQYNNPDLKIPKTDPNNPEEWQKFARKWLPPGVFCYDLENNSVDRITAAEWGKGAVSPSWAPDGRHFVCSYQGKAAVIDSKARTIRMLPGESAWYCHWTWKTNLIVYKGSGRLDNRPVNLVSVVTPDGKNRTDIPWAIREFLVDE